uniref:Replication factor A C-terminal domain-containing protein n=1 Tax=Chenopodium quinoa TaxID=63459 RepID=A0A803M336_CHEQI
MPPMVNQTYVTLNLPIPKAQILTIYSLMATDVVGLVLFADEEVRLVNFFYGQKAYVREVVITYQTNTQPIIVNVWNHLAGSACEKLNVWAEKFIVVSFTSAKASTLKGFSLSTGMDTRIIYEPKGDKANVLREWSNLYLQRLLDRQARILQAQNSLQDERHWLPATISTANLQQLTIYTGCLKCGKPTTLPEGREFGCTKCYTKETVACIRVTFTFDVVDNTDSISLTAFSNEVEKILGMHAKQIYAIKENEDHISFEKAKQNFSSKLLHLKVAPTPALTATNKLQWSLEDTIIESMEEDKTMKEVEGNTKGTSSTTDRTEYTTIGVKDFAKAAFPDWSMHKRRRTSLEKQASQIVNTSLANVEDKTSKTTGIQNAATNSDSA